MFNNFDFVYAHVKNLKKNGQKRDAVALFTPFTVWVINLRLKVNETLSQNTSGLL